MFFKHIKRRKKGERAKFRMEPFGQGGGEKKTFRGLGQL
jgi:hypothetical protein